MNLLITTKNSTVARRKGGTIANLILILVGLGIFIFSFSVFDEIGIEFESVLLLVISLLLLSDGIIQLLMLYYTTSSYVDIYNDHMEGKGMQGLEIKNFSLKNSDINNITISGAVIHIHSNSGIFKVTSNKKLANKIFNYYQSNLHK